MIKIKIMEKIKKILNSLRRLYYLARVRVSIFYLMSLVLPAHSLDAQGEVDSVSVIHFFLYLWLFAACLFLVYQIGYLSGYDSGKEVQQVLNIMSK